MPSILDFAVRETERPPPWKQPRVLNGRISAFIAAWTATYLSFGFRYFRALGFLGGVATYAVLSHGFLVADALLSNGFGRNVQNLRKAGYSDLVILGYMEFNLFAATTIESLVANFFVTDPKSYDIDYIVGELISSPGILLKIALGLGVAEVLFALGHGMLHTSRALMDLHVFHHCCTFSTFNTNMMFHPVDLAIEFSGPVLGILGMHAFLWDDQLALLLTFTIFQLWYAYDHDENMRLYHLEHHRRCDSLYVIYTNMESDPGKNALRKRMLDFGLQWP